MSEKAAPKSYRALLENIVAKRSPIARGLLICGGTLTVSVALIIDGHPGFGRGQFLLLLAGLATLLSGILGPRLARFYNEAAIVFLNIVILLLLLELAAIALARSGILPSKQLILASRYASVPYYRAQEWTRTHWREAQSVEAYRYRSYTGWRHRPFQGETINIDTQGIRHTPGADCGAHSIEVFTFGGSTMWGWGSPDWETIAAHLQEDLQSQSGRPVCVINFGEDAFVSTQGLIELIRQIQLGRRPRIVLFYDGFNDVFAAWRNSGIEEHGYAHEFASKIEENQPTLRWLQSSRLFSMTVRLVSSLREPKREGYQQRAVETSDLADSIVRLYLANYRAVGALAEEYGFLYFFFWQPQIGLGQKDLTENEQKILIDLDPDLAALQRATKEKLWPLSDHYPNLWILADAFDAREEQIWIDGYGHVTPVGNQIIAKRMIIAMTKSLAFPLDLK